MKKHKYNIKKTIVDIITIIIRRRIINVRGYKCSRSGVEGVQKRSAHATINHLAR